MRIFSCITFLFLLCACSQSPVQSPLVMWYETPAQNWNEALPVGNGRSGAMIFGGVENEQLQLNENTLYSGEPSVAFKDVKITPEMFDRVVNLIQTGRYTDASNLVCEHWLGRLHQCYQPFGGLRIRSNQAGPNDAYKRFLNLSDAIVTTSYEQNGVRYTREIFASHPDDVIVIHIQSDAADSLDLSLDFTSPHPTASQKAGGDRLILQGQAPGYVERRTFGQIERWGDQYKHPELYEANGKRKYNHRVLYGDEIDGKGMFFEAQLKPVLPDGGVCEITDTGIHVSQTDEVYFLLGMATSFNGFDKSPSREGVNPSQKAAAILKQAMAYDYQTLKQRHTTDYRSLFDRVRFRLESTPEQKALPTDQRLQQFAQTADPDLAALLFQYGRYLMISGSRPGGQPLNLQGIWNKDTIPAWNSGYTININTEMNYWPAEVTNLSECQEPLLRLIRELAQSGTETARNMYGRRGWIAHHNTSIWRESYPNDNVPDASFWPMAQGWLCSHLWEHFQFTQDSVFLRNEAYPLMKGAAEFYMDWLVEDGNGHLVTPVGISPENSFITDDGQKAAISMGPTMDMAIVRELFTRTLQTAEMFHLDGTFRDELKTKLDRLLPYQIGKRGQLQEWMYDFKELEPQHRHFSHLYGFHPSDQITPDKTPELFQAVRKSLELRGDFATGWSMGWKINCWARLLDGNHAYKIIANLFNPVGFGNGHKGGGLFRNLFCAHPPFQIDGNFGYTAGVAEMLLQSHAGYIHLLPAIPDVWSEGSISGLKARGNFELAFSWEAGKLQEAQLLSQAGKTCTLRCAQPFTVRQHGQYVVASSAIQVNGQAYFQATFPTEKGKQYQVVPEK